MSRWWWLLVKKWCGDGQSARGLEAVVARRNQRGGQNYDAATGTPKRQLPLSANHTEAGALSQPYRHLPQPSSSSFSTSNSAFISPNYQLAAHSPYQKTMLGKLVHIGFDALLISAFLAGIRRTTGLTYVYHCGELLFLALNASLM